MTPPEIDPIQYDLEGILNQGVGLQPQQFEALIPRLETARSEVLKDVELLRSPEKIPVEKEPLDARFIDFPAGLLAEYAASRADSTVGKILAACDRLAQTVDLVVVIGIGGSYLGAQSLFKACCHPFHNELSRERRRGRPRLHFAGYNLDNDATQDLLEFLKSEASKDPAFRWGIVVVSKSGGTLEPTLAFRYFLSALRETRGADAGLLRRLLIPITGLSGELRRIAGELGCESVFEVPDRIGGRFSILTACGLVPAAILGVDIVKLLEGARFTTEQFKKLAVRENPVLAYAGVCHLAEVHLGSQIRVMSVWCEALETLGYWYDQLLSESLGKDGRGATPLTTVNTRDLHSRGQQHQQGRHDKLITNVFVSQDRRSPLPIGTVSPDIGDLNKLAAKTMGDATHAALLGTNQAYRDAQRPTADLRLPRVDEASMGQVYQMLMLATVVEGRMIGANPYGQPGVENYKRNMRSILGY